MDHNTDDTRVHLIPVFCQSYHHSYFLIPEKTKNVYSLGGYADRYITGERTTSIDARKEIKEKIASFLYEWLYHERGVSPPNPL